ncbi:hypothetical protein KBZ94_23715 [Streptomyces sp. RM72]|uniref:hypothetical protein n=1 Tax=Streptomyces sp. RM72 TaxID=1115510 RepID=UPI001B35F480|nr:hypothetical protein [Streptomyces sp. RM72]MBQ0887891.1 hypothetical protein [Streptomyces sp. RM72]
MTTNNMRPCVCDAGFSQGPALLAADLQHQQELAKESRSTMRAGREEVGALALLLTRLACRLRGDAPVTLDFNDEAATVELSTSVLQEQVAWLVEHRYLALDGMVDGLARLWINPAVAFLPRTTDPRRAAARHRFPYIVTDAQGMSAQQRVHVVQYDEDVWQRVHQLNAEQFNEPPTLRHDCPLHHSASPFPGSRDPQD